MCGAPEKLIGSVFFKDFALCHKQDSCANFSCKIHLVGDYDHCHTLFCNLLDEVQNFPYHFGVKGGGGLVKEQNFGAHCKGTSNGNTLLLTT